LHDSRYVERQQKKKIIRRRRTATKNPWPGEIWPRQRRAVAVGIRWRTGGVGDGVSFHRAVKPTITRAKRVWQTFANYCTYVPIYVLDINTNKVMNTGNVYRFNTYAYPQNRGQTYIYIKYYNTRNIIIRTILLYYQLALNIILYNTLYATFIHFLQLSPNFFSTFIGTYNDHGDVAWNFVALRPL
jgi:hypothetical protein